MSIRVLLFLSIIVGLCACGRQEKTLSLTSSSLYDIDSVRAVLDSSRTPGKAWDTRLSQAVALYRKKHLYTTAADSLKNLIYEYPSPKAYYELGTALLIGKQYPEALQALHIAEKLQYSPLANVLYELSATYANMPSPSEDTVNYYMEVSLQMGFTAPEKFKLDPAFRGISKNEHFQDAYKEAMSGRKDPERMLWNDFQHGFSTLTLPLTIDDQWFKAHPPTANIDDSYEHYIPEVRSVRFARGNTPEFFFIGKVKEDAKYIAVIYCGSDDWGGDEDGDSTAKSGPSYCSVTFYLTTFDHHGTIIDKVPFAGGESGTAGCKVFSMNPTLEFSIKEPEAGIIENYRIDPEGKFERVQSTSLSMR